MRWSEAGGWLIEKHDVNSGHGAAGEQIRKEFDDVVGMKKRGRDRGGERYS